MGIRALISFGLIAVPVGVTLGLLLGLDSHRRATGQAPLFQDNSISTDQYCQKAYGIHPESVGQSYTLNPNQWGWTEGTEGYLCMNVTSFSNGTYPTNTTAPEFSVTWQYPQGPETQPVHAFPNIALDSDGANFPITISNLKNLWLDVEWHYALGNESTTTTDTAALVAANVNTNVAIDMFLDADKSNSQSTTQAKYEIMIWLAMIGPAAQPVGWGTNGDAVVATQVVNGTTFQLFSGVNGQQQHVLTWLATQTMDTFVGDVAPLVNALGSLNIADSPASSDWLGYMGLGSEAYWTPEFVTFNVSRLSMQVA